MTKDEQLVLALAKLKEIEEIASSLAQFNATYEKIERLAKEGQG